MSLPKQFSVCVNLGSTQKRVPYLLNMQHAHAALETCLAAPVVPSASRRVIDRADIRLSIDGGDFVAVVSHLSARPRKEFGAGVYDAEVDRYTLLNALDFLTNGF